MKFQDKLRQMLHDNGISIAQFERESGIAKRFFYRDKYHKPHKATIAAIAYYFGIGAEELVEGTDAEDAWYI